MTTNQTNSTTNEQATTNEQPKAAPQETSFDWKGFAKTASVAAAGAVVGAAGMWAWNHFTE